MTLKIRLRDETILLDVQGASFTEEQGTIVVGAYADNHIARRHPTALLVNGFYIFRANRITLHWAQKRVEGILSGEGPDEFLFTLIL